jgi:hypothetical protein
METSNNVISTHTSLGVTWALEQEAGSQMPEQWRGKRKLHYIKYEWKNEQTCNFKTPEA